MHKEFVKIMSILFIKDFLKIYRIKEMFFKTLLRCIGRTKRSFLPEEYVENILKFN